MRPRYQGGSIVEKNGNWVLRFYEDRISRDGQHKRVRASKVLAPVGGAYRTKTQVKHLADEQLQGTRGVQPSGLDGTLSVGEFIENRYFPHLETRMQLTGALRIEPSTVHGYQDIWKRRVKDTATAAARLSEFKTPDAQKFCFTLDSSLSHQTHLRAKAFLSGVFSYALQIGAISGVNPFDNVTVGGQRKTFTGRTYTLAEVSHMLETLPEPGRTAVAVAAFTGLSASEIRGLKWSDCNGDALTVRRKVWRTHVGLPKTEARGGTVPVIPVLKRILRDYKKEFPPSSSDFIFRGDRRGFALNLDNVWRRTIKPVLGNRWAGWHSFRRGLATRLFYLGVDAKTVQLILRHANVSTTLAHYVIPDPKEAATAMAKLEKALKLKRKRARSSIG